MTHAEEQEIERLFGHMSRAWNVGSGKAYAEAFTEDCDYIAFDGTRLKGNWENGKHHQRLFDTVLKGSRLVIENLSIRFLSADIALVHGEGSVLMPWHRDVPAHRRSIQTYVIVKQREGWRVRAFHNTRIRPMRLPEGWRLSALLALMRLRRRLGPKPDRSGLHPA